PRHKGELKLDTENPALDRKAPFQPKGTKANAVNSRAAEKNRTRLKFGEREHLSCWRWRPRQRERLVSCLADNVRERGRVRCPDVPRTLMCSSQSARRPCYPTPSTNHRSCAHCSGLTNKCAQTRCDWSARLFDNRLPSLCRG